VGSFDICYSVDSVFVALYLNRRLWPFTAPNSVLTQFWCSLGTCGTFAGIDDKSVISRKPLLRSEQRDASPRWIIEADGQDSAICPGCQSVSRLRHSRYWRSLQDLPVQGTPVILPSAVRHLSFTHSYLSVDVRVARVHVGRWRCRNAACKRRIFTERPLNVCAPNARQTKRSDEIIAVVGRAL
jgi:hypothetical protein